MRNAYRATFRTARAESAILALVLTSCSQPSTQRAPDPPAAAPVETALPPAAMVLIPSGSFMMGALDDDDEARPCEHPRHEVTLSSFLLDEHEVTVAAYAAAVRAGAVSEPINRLHFDWHAEYITWDQPDKRDHPINGVSWHQADAYCRHMGKRLPTEAEYEYVMRAGVDGALYPWGDSREPPPHLGNLACMECPPRYAENEPIQGCRDPYIHTAPVKSFEPNAFGLYDIVGNAWEWCADWYGASYYAASPALNPQGPATGDDDHKTMRGGGHHCVLTELRSSERHHKPADDGAVFVGFRCAMDAPPDQGEGRPAGASG